MKHLACLLIVTSVLIESCSEHKASDDFHELKRVFESYFHAIETKDYKKLRDETTENFMLYEMGRVWNNDSVIVNIERNLPFEVRYTFKEHKIHVDQNSGDITCFNHGEFVFGDSTAQSFDWIESATFRMIDGKWKMNFLHITERYKTDERIN